MAKITYNGMDLEEQLYSEPTIINDSREAIVWNDYANKDRVIVLSYDPRSKYPVRSNNDRFWKHFAFIPEKPAPSMATNRELAKWLAQGNGEVLSLMPTTNGHSREVVTTDWYYFSGDDSKTVDYGFEGQRCKGVRKWDDEEWHTPDVEYMGITEVKTYEDVVKREG